METFGELLRSPGHWAFEIFLMVLFDGIIVGLLFPFARKHWKHHVARDRAETTKVIPEYTDWSGFPEHPSSSLPTRAGQTHQFYRPDVWTGGPMKEDDSVGVVISKPAKEWSGSHPDHVLFSNTSDDDPEKWPDLGTERCMDCLCIIVRLDEQAAKCPRCGTVNPPTMFGDFEAAV